MTVYVRLSAALARAAGTTRLVVQIPEGATVETLLEQLRTSHPELGGRLQIALPVLSGRHVPPTATLAPEQEVALLLPAAGG